MKFFFPYFGPLVAHTVVTKDQLKDLKNICNKNAKVQGVKYWKYILKAKDYVPLKDLKEWIKKEEVEQIKKQQEEDKAYQERVKHGGRF